MKRKTWMIAIFALVVAAAAGGAVYVSQSAPGDREGSISGSGTVEGNPLVVRTKLQGQLVELNVEEGDRVTKGQVLARLDAREINDKLRQAEAGLEAAKAQADLNLTEGEAGKISQAEAGVGMARSLLVQAQAGYDLARERYDNAQKLYDAGAIPKADLTDASQAFKAAQGKLEEAQNGVNNAQAGFDVALAQQKLAAAVLAEAQGALADTVITAPIDGTITLKAVSNGELVSQGLPLVEITNLDDLSLTIYLPEPEAGKVKLGQAAEISVDSAPGKIFTGEVVNISDQAEFTPNNVQMKEDRVKLVYAVKIRIDSPEGIIKPGMPADAVLR